MYRFENHTLGTITFTDALDLFVFIVFSFFCIAFMKYDFSMPAVPIIIIFLYLLCP